jgi:hypothetical protein
VSLFDLFLSASYCDGLIRVVSLLLFLASCASVSHTFSAPVVLYPFTCAYSVFFLLCFVFPFWLSFVIGVPTAQTGNYGGYCWAS